MSLGSSTPLGLTLTLNSASRFVGKMLSIERKEGVLHGNAGAAVSCPCSLAGWPGCCPAAVGYLKCWGVLELSHQAPWPGHHGQGDFVPLLLQHWDQF